MSAPGGPACAPVGWTPRGILGDNPPMPPLRCLVVELPTALAQDLTQRLTALGVHVAAADASTVVDSLVTAPPDVAIVNLALSHGSGFGLVNRVLHMEALAGLKIVLVAEDATPDVLDAHRHGPTPAAAYVRRTDGSSDVAFATGVLSAVQGLLAHHLPEMYSGDLVEVARDDAAGEGALSSRAQPLGGELQRTVSVVMTAPRAMARSASG